MTIISYAGSLDNIAMLNCGNIIDIVFKLLPFDLRPVSVPKDKVRILVLADNSTKFVFSNTEIGCSLFN